jgi:O-antigen ligase
MASTMPHCHPGEISPPQYRPPGWGRTNRVVRHGRFLRGLASLHAQLSLKPRRLDILLIVGYLVVTRIGSLSAAKWGIQVGPVPLYLTDMTLIALLTVSMVKRPGQVLYWGSAGQQAGVAGQAVWLLCVTSIVHFVFAFPTYKIFAVRDLGIFIYSMFFPLTYFAVNSRIWAKRITRYFVYSGMILAMLAIFQLATGIKISFVGTIDRTVLGRDITYIGNDDFGGILAASTMGLISYTLLERKRRAFHLVGAASCFFAMASTGTRSSIVAVTVAVLVTFMLLSARHRLALGIVAVSFGALLIGSVALPPTLPGVKALHDFYVGILSATGGASDANSAFRLERWTDAIHTWSAHPVFGVGFGRNILHQVYIGFSETGKFNQGMPHNTFLYLLARSGLLGFGLVATAIAVGLWKLGVAVRRYRQPDDLAAMNSLVSMVVFACFVLFFERPMTNADFWIMLAVGFRLAQTSNSEMEASVPRKLAEIPAELPGATHGRDPRPRFAAARLGASRS